jgi:hypothetical protein
MSTTAAPRPFEEEALFNPAFLSLLLRESAAQYSARSGGRDLPTVLAYLIAPVALHGPTREVLPTHVTAQMGEWVRAHPVCWSISRAARAACAHWSRLLPASGCATVSSRARTAFCAPVALNGALTGWPGAPTSMRASREPGSSEALIWPGFPGGEGLESGGDGCCGVLVFVFGGCEHVQGAVASAGVVPGFDVVMDRGGKFDACLPLSAVE